jgi:hypothetical protein
VEITEDLYEDGSRPILEFEAPGSDFYGLTQIEYQGAIIEWLQREYGEHVHVEYALYDEYLVVRNELRYVPTHRARLSELLLLNRVIKYILHDDASYLPENPEFAYECIISIQNSRAGVQIERGNYEFRGRRLL